ncbi:hypothetical protein [Planctomicrobium piriforme]|nr:hypothetical protein [Planctomicrobium piriforme]
MADAIAISIDPKGVVTAQKAQHRADGIHPGRDSEAFVGESWRAKPFSVSYRWEPTHDFSDLHTSTSLGCHDDRDVSVALVRWRHWLGDHCGFCHVLSQLQTNQATQESGPGLMVDDRAMLPVAPTQRCRHLRLATVLVMTAGLVGGVATCLPWPWLNANERRLVGRWLPEETGGVFEYHFGRHKILNCHGPQPTVKLRWSLDMEGRLTLQEEFIPRKRLMRKSSIENLRLTIEETEFVRKLRGDVSIPAFVRHVSWKDEDTFLLYGTTPEGTKGKYNATMHRVPSQK